MANIIEKILNLLSITIVSILTTVSKIIVSITTTPVKIFNNIISNTYPQVNDIRKSEPVSNVNSYININ